MGLTSDHFQAALHHYSQRGLGKHAYEITFMMLIKTRRNTTLMMALLLRLALQSFHIAFDICPGVLSHDRKNAAD